MIDRLHAEEIEEALNAVGELLAAVGERHAIVVVGGATMSLLGLVRRSTSDVDVIARAYGDVLGEFRLEPAEPFPAALDRAIRTVARDLGLAEGWMNAVVGGQWSQGLPPGMTEDITWRTYGEGLDVGLAGRRTLIALKLFAAADAAPESVHTQDLLALRPMDEELEQAAEWVRTQDEASQWASLVAEVIEHVRRDRS